jgi:Tol biopolymer transport system component
MKRFISIAGYIFITLAIPASAQLPQKISSFLETINVSTGKRTVVFSDSTHFEAPNWSKDGKYLLINKKGKLYKVWLGNPGMEAIPFPAALGANNDHGISPNGQVLAISSSVVEEDDPLKGGGSSVIYTAPVNGGPLKRLTKQSPSYWHGWSPDGATLAFVGRRNGDFDIYTIPAAGGEEKQLTTAKGLDDGPDYSPDGKYIYFNSFRTGRMQIWRMDADGGHPVQLTNDRYANWFPHPSPDGKQLVFLTFIDNQGEDHPFGKNVQLRLLDLATNSIRNLTPVFFGGQGTINVPSWSPDGKQLAFVSYRLN